MTQRHEIESGARGSFKVLKSRIVIVFGGPVSTRRNFFFISRYKLCSFRFNRIKWHLYLRISYFKLSSVAPFETEYLF